MAPWHAAHFWAKSGPTNPSQVTVAAAGDESGAGVEASGAGVGVDATGAGVGVGGIGVGVCGAKTTTVARTGSVVIAVCSKETNL